MAVMPQCSSDKKRSGKKNDEKTGRKKRSRKEKRKLIAELPF